MAAMDEAFWAELDAQIVANRPDGESRAPVPAEADVQAPSQTVAGDTAGPPAWVASDWSGVLDTLTAAKSAAQDQDARLRSYGILAEVADSLGARQAA